MIKKPDTLFSREETIALVVLSVIVLLSRSAFVFLNDHLLVGTVFVDDAFYSLTVARHLALGQGITIDGVHPTNGFQPLQMLLQAGCSWLAGEDRFLAIRYCFVLSAIIETSFIWCGAIFLKHLGRHRSELSRWWLSPAVVFAVIETFTFELFAMHSNGLETALYALSIVLLLDVVQRRNEGRRYGIEPNGARTIALGVLAGLVVLSRIDGAVLVLIIALMELRYRNGFRNMVFIGGMSLIISTPWCTYNVAQFGSLMPISGQAETLWPRSPHAGQDTIEALTQIFLFIVPAYSKMFATSLEIIIALFCAGVLAFSAQKTRLLASLRKTYRLDALLPLGAFSLFLVVYYVFFFHATWFLERYLHPVELLWVWIVSLSIAQSIPAFQKKTLRGFAIALLSVFALRNIQYERRVYLPQVPSNLAEIGFWASEHPSERIGVIQSGTAGYLADNITNLDGKVNPSALSARKSDSLGAYIQQMKFDVLADEEQFIGVVLQDSARFKFHYHLIGRIRDAVFYGRAEQ